MGLVRRIAVITALGVMTPGCVQILGLDDPVVSGNYVIREVRNDGDHVPTVAESDPDASTVMLTLDDGTAIPITWGPGGSFVFPVSEDRRYHWKVGSVEYQHTGSRFEAAKVVLGRSDRTAAPAGTRLVYRVPDAPGTAAIRVATTGLWTQTDRAQGTNISFEIDWPAAASLSGPIGLLRADANDRAYFIAEETLMDPVGHPYKAITRYRTDDLTLVPGGTANVDGNSMPVGQDLCTHVVIKRTAELARLVNAGYGTSFSFDWRIDAIPSPSIGTSGALRLAYDPVSASGQMDADLFVPFGNPFDGHAPLLSLGAFANRVIKSPNNGTQGLAVGTRYNDLVPPTASCPITPTTIAGTVGLPTVPLLDAVSLTVENAPFVVEAAANPKLIWSVATGQVDRYTVGLFKVTDHDECNACGDCTTVVDLTRIATYVTTVPEVIIDAALLETSAMYVFQIAADLGYPSAKHGDLRTVTFPFQTATTWSGTFTVIART